ncbi:MAG: hypothetical protein BA066_04205 [Candidatus Korarchaeota archaeon NZ13-K]|nr:MAG: hypothetical protein BA066_04205 [Candidatus Korarchaeota archaeon NZ13-K]
MRRLEVSERLDIICRGAWRIDEYRAEGYIIRDPPRYLVLVVERDGESGTTPSVWLGEFSSYEEARDSLRDVLYNIGRREDRGFGCHEAIPSGGEVTGTRRRVRVNRSELGDVRRG